MRDEKEERKKQARSNKQTRQSNTAHPRQSLFLEKMSCFRWDSNPRHSHMYDFTVIIQSYPYTSVVESYESADRHTYISAAVTALSCLLMLLGLTVLYKKLAPRSTPQSSPRKHESTNHVIDDVDGMEKVDLGKMRFD